MTKCPYVPPHEFNLDYTHLMLRYRAVEQRKGGPGFVQRQLVETDRNGRLAGAVSGLANWAGDTGNGMTRPVLEKVAGVHREARLPKYHSKTLVARGKDRDAAPAVNPEAPAHGRKAVLYATCFSNYNAPEIGLAARAVLAHNGVETEIAYPGCCGMPQLEQGNVSRVAAKAKHVAAEMGAWIDKGYDVDTKAERSLVTDADTAAEAMILDALERLTPGLPIIAGRSGGAPETITDPRCGSVVDGRDRAAVAEALGRWLDDEDGRRAVRSHGPQVAGQWSWEAVARRFDELIVSLAR
jgi:hypothetical protein